MARRRGEVAEESTVESAGEEQAAAHQPGPETEREPFPPEPNPRSWAHCNVAGVQLRSRREPYQAELVFSEKPSQQVIDVVKEGGFQWDRHEKAWIRPVGYNTQAQDRLMASRTYQNAVNLILEEKGLSTEVDPPPF